MSRVSLSAKHARALLLLAESSGTFNTEITNARDALAAALKPRPASSAKKKTAAKKRARQEQTSQIHEVVMARACGRCECGCGNEEVEFDRLEMDHFFGRGRAESVESCWALLAGCHTRKTQNWPDSARWLKAFIAHAERHGYTAEADRARARLHGIVAMRAGGAR